MFQQFRRVAVAAFVLGGLLAVVAQAADAHTKFLGSAPASGVELPRAPQIVTLRFEEDAQIGFLHVVDARGTDRELGAPYHPDGELTRVEVRLPPLERASYIVDWQVVADDGHVSRGRFAFGVGVPAAVVLPESSSSPGSVAIVAVLRFALLAALLLAVGLAFGAFSVVRPPNVAPVSMLEFGSWLVVAFVAFVDVRVQSAITGSTLVATLNTRYGVLHLSLMFAAFLGAIAVSGGRRRWELLITAAIVALLSESMAGHAGTGVLPIVGVTFDTAHLLAAATWIGVLITTLMATDIVDVRRTSNVATAAVALLLVSAVVQVLRNVVPLSGMFTSAYGIEIVVKIVLFALVAAIALQSRRRVDAGAVAVAASGRYEVLILSAVIAVTAVLVDGQPPR